MLNPKGQMSRAFLKKYDMQEKYREDSNNYGDNAQGVGGYSTLYGNPMYSSDSDGMYNAKGYAGNNMGGYGSSGGNQKVNSYNRAMKKKKGY